MTSLHKIVLDDDLFVVYQKVIAGEEADTRKVRALLGAIQMDDLCLHGIRGTGYHSPRKETLSKECLPAMALRHLHMLQDLT